MPKQTHLEHETLHACWINHMAGYLPTGRPSEPANIIACEPKDLPAREKANPWASDPGSLAVLRAREPAGPSIGEPVRYSRLRFYGHVSPASLASEYLAILACLQAREMVKTRSRDPIIPASTCHLKNKHKTKPRLGIFVFFLVFQ